MKDLEILAEDGEIKRCRICKISDDFRMISPCKCTGSHKFVHDECLKKWINCYYEVYLTSACEMCNYNFKMTVEKETIYDPKNARGENSCCYCTFLIISFSLFILCFALTLVCIFRLDFKNNETMSFIIVGIFLFPIVVGLLIMPLLIYKVTYRTVVRLWEIYDYKGENLSFIGPPSSY